MRSACRRAGLRLRNLRRNNDILSIIRECSNSAIIFLLGWNTNMNIFVYLSQEGKSAEGVPGEKPSINIF